MFGGNPLAVVLDADGLTPTQMQALASEFQYSETTFVLPPLDPAHTAHVRIFTPRAEVPFAGHPNIGTAFVLARFQEARERSSPDTFVFEEGAGLVPLRILRAHGAVVGAELRAPEPLSRRSQVSVEAAAACLSLRPEDLATAVHVPLIISVGLPFLVVELVSRDALRRAKPYISAYEKILPRDGADAIFAYTADDASGGGLAETAVLHARMFAPLDGIVEDPATGSATAAILALLTELSPQSTLEHSWRVHQGVDMGRPSLLLGHTTKRDSRLVSVDVGGQCVAVMEGTFALQGGVR